MFHGTSGEVTVPESSTARLSTCGARPLRRNSSRNIRAGRTSATYWSPAVTLSPIALEFTARIRLPRDLRPGHDGLQEPVEEARVLQDRRERHRREHEPHRRQEARHPAAGEQLVDRLDPAVAHEAGRHRPVDRLGRRSRTRPSSGSSTKASTADHWVKHARMPANSADPMIARNGGTFFTVKTTSSASGSRLTTEMLKALSSGVERLVGADLGAGVHAQPDDQEDRQADAERRSGGPEHVPDVLAGGQAAHELRHQDRRLRERRHLVAEVRAADDGAGRDRLRDAQHVRHPDERDAERAGRGPRAAGDHADDRADRRRRQEEHARIEQPGRRSRRRSGSCRPCSRCRSTRRPTAG